jgi:hypothetical protein
MSGACRRISCCPLRGEYAEQLLVIDIVARYVAMDVDDPPVAPPLGGLELSLPHQALDIGAGLLEQSSPLQALDIGAIAAAVPDASLEPPETKV